MRDKEQRVMVAMSGGVDSSVCACILAEEGYKVSGAIMNLTGSDCFERDAEDAESVANAMGLPFYRFDMRDEFRRDVIDPFVLSYEKGETPNPCVNCNRTIKFDGFFERASELGFDRIATGHYAVIEKDQDTGRYLLKKARDPRKDQSYFLYTLTQDQLAKTILPLGKIEKSVTRRIAEEHGFVSAKRRESQDICFVPDGDYVSFIKKTTGRKYPEGDFVDKDGRVLGRHRGILNYTTGQRKGLGLALPKPMYVCERDVENNRVILCHKEDLFIREFTVCKVNWIAVEGVSDSIRAEIKVRYSQKQAPGRIENCGEGRYRVIFDEPQRAVTKGQAAVFYDGDTVLGGGTIENGLSLRQ